MPGTLMPWVKSQWFTNAGAPAASHKLFFYAAGTTTKQSTFSDVDLTVANANPLILDSAGRATVYFTPGLSYKVVFTTNGDSDPPVSPIWTQDNVDAIGAANVALDVAGVAGAQWAESDPQVLFLSDGTNGLTAGRWYRANQNNNAYSSAAWIGIQEGPSSVVAGSPISVRLGGRIEGFSGLTAGLTYYVDVEANEGGITSTAPTDGVLRVVGKADSTTSLILGVPPKAGNRDRVTAMLAEVGNVGTGEDTLRSYLANVQSQAAELAVNGSYYHITAGGRTANNANVKTIRLRLIEGANDTLLMAFLPTVSEAGEWWLDVTLVRTVTTAGRSHGFIACGPTNGAVSRSGTVNAVPTCTWANDYEIRLTGEGTATNDVVCTTMTITRHE